MNFVDDLVHNIRASDETFLPLLDAFTLQEVQELTLTVGFYMMTCRFLETFDVDIEETPTDLNL